MWITKTKFLEFLKAKEVFMNNFDELMKIQQQMAGRIMQESETDQKLELMDIINSLTTIRRPKVQVEQVILEAQNHGMTEDQALRAIDELIDFGYVTQPEEGFLQRV